MENSEKFYKDGLNFTCAKCSFCCGHSPGFVYLSKRDLFALCEYKNLPVKSFVEKYCRWADYYYGTQVLALIEKNNYDCVLWENGCSCSPNPMFNISVLDMDDKRQRDLGTMRKRVSRHQHRRMPFCQGD